MLAGADDLGRWAALAADGEGAPVGTGSAELAQGEGNEIQGFATIGALAGAIVGKLGQDRAARTAPREMARAPAAGSVATKGRRRPNLQEVHVTIGTTRVFATVLAAFARERPDRGENLLAFIETEAKGLREQMPGTADAMREACAEARRLRARDRLAAG